MSVSVFVANSCGTRTVPASSARAIVRASAVARTSAGAPAPSWSTRLCDPSNDSTTSTPGLSSSNRSAMASNGFCSDAAANTVNVRSSPSSPPPSLSPHAANPAASPTAVAAAAMRAALRWPCFFALRRPNAAIIGPSRRHGVFFDMG